MKIDFCMSVLVWWVSGIPVILLTGMALLGRAVGEWGREALLAYVAVLLALLSGMGIAIYSGWIAWVCTVIGLFGSFIGLVIGAPVGLAIIGSANIVLAGLSIYRGECNLPWPLLMAVAAACAIVIMQYYLILSE